MIVLTKTKKKRARCGNQESVWFKESHLFQFGCLVRMILIYSIESPESTHLVGGHLGCLHIKWTT